jgi:hypothetical protein
MAASLALGLALAQSVERACVRAMCNDYEQHFGVP